MHGYTRSRRKGERNFFMMEGSKVRQESDPGERKKGATLQSLGEELEEEVTNPSKRGRSA